MLAHFLRAVVPTIACSAAASAQLTFVLQDRSVTADGVVSHRASTISDSDSESASGFGEFQAAVRVDLDHPLGESDGYADQHTVLARDVLAGLMVAEASTSRRDIEVLADANASSHFDLLFDLASAQHWRALITGSAAESAGATFLLTEVAEHETEILSWDAVDAASLRRTLLLRPARYRLTVDLNASAVTGPEAESRAQTEWSFTLIPAPPSLAALAPLIAFPRRRPS